MVVIEALKTVFMPAQSLVAVGSVAAPAPERKRLVAAVDHALPGLVSLEFILARSGASIPLAFPDDEQKLKLIG